MVNLMVEQRFAKLGLNITPFRFDLVIKKPDAQVNQKPAEIFLSQPAATLEIDYSQFREALGYYGIYASQKVHVEDAKQSVGVGIERRVQEGNELGAIEKEISIAEVVGQAIEPKEQELLLVNLPPIEISFVERPIQWDVKYGGVSLQVNNGSVNATFMHGSVKGYLEQKPSITLKAVGTVFDKSR